MSSACVRHRTGSRDVMRLGPFIDGLWIARMPADHFLYTITRTDEMKRSQWDKRGGNSSRGKREKPYKNVTIQKVVTTPSTGMFSVLLRSVQILKSGVWKATGSYRTYSIPGKTATLILSLQWKTYLRQNCSLGSCARSEEPAFGQNTLMMIMMTPSAKRWNGYSSICFFFVNQQLWNSKHHK